MREFIVVGTGVVAFLGMLGCFIMSIPAQASVLMFLWLIATAICGCISVICFNALTPGESSTNGEYHD